MITRRITLIILAADESIIGRYFSLFQNLTGGVNGGLHMTDCSNASRTMLMNLRSLTWDTELCKFFDIPSKLLPEIRSSSEIYGHVATGLLKGVAISGVGLSIMYLYFNYAKMYVISALFRILTDLSQLFLRVDSITKSTLTQSLFFIIGSSP